MQHADKGLSSIASANSYAHDHDQWGGGGFNWFRLGRQVHLIILSVVISLTVALAYIALRTPVYTAVAQLLIDHKVIQLIREDAMFAASGVGAALLQNQVAILESEMIARKVIENLNLTAEEQFQLGPTGPAETAADAAWEFSQLVELAVSPVTEPPAHLDSEVSEDSDKEQVVRDRYVDVALDIFREYLSVQAAGKDYSISIKFTAPDPDSAARITNEITRVYLEDQVESNKRAAEAASAWLRGRIAELGTSARVLTEARPPREPSGLSSSLIVGGSLAAGLLFGFAAAFARELSDRRIRLPGEAAAVTGADYLGSLPTMKNRLRRPHIVHGKKPARWEKRRIIQPQINAFSWALDYPLSQFTHTINRIGIAASDAVQSGARRTLAIGVTSVAPREGRTVVAANLARTMAKSGQRVLLIDAVPYNLTLSRGFSANEPPALLDVLEKKDVTLAGAIWVDRRTGMHFLPLSASDERASDSPLVWSKAMEGLVRERKRYDYIIFDLPPLGPVEDVAAAGRFIDKFVLVMEWEQLTPDIVRDSLASAGSTQDKLIGVVLNKVRTSRWQAFIDGEISPTRGDARYINEGTKS